MAAIYLIRHGQASYDKADYDQLSDKGITQAQILGKHWQSFAKPDKFYSGDLLRHGQTLKHFLLGYHDVDSAAFSSNTLPAAQQVKKVAGFNEFDHVDILTRYKPQWQDFDRMSRDVASHHEPQKAFIDEFSQAISRWVSAAFNHEYQETWLQFKTRCITALQEVIDQGLAQKNTLSNCPSTATAGTASSAQDIFIFTSAGPIAVIIQYILALSDQHTLMINQQLRNTGVTKLLFSDNKLSIDYINNYSHLALAGAHWTSFR